MTPVSYLETGVIYCDDNLHRLSEFPAECVDLIYLDPPFFSNRHYEVIWGDEAEVRSFEDRWEGGIHVYVNWMRERMIEMHRVLKPSGSIYLHCDWHASHYLKVMMDDLFGEANLQGEIIWHYRKWPTGKYAFQRNHDTILFYSKSQSRERVFNQLYMDRAPSTLKRFGTAKIVSAFDESGRRVPSQVEDADSTGVRMDDVWEIARVPPSGRERLGYPTQKPRALLQRIIEASSNPGDVVLDPFCGCGTTLVAAQLAQRQWIGIDISPTAVGVIKRVLHKAGALDVKLVGMPVTEDQLHALKPFEFQNWVIQNFKTGPGTHASRKSGDMGIDGYSFLEHLPIQVKQSHRVGRNVVDNFETAVERDGKGKGYIVAFSFSRGAHEEAARVKESKGLEIELVNVADLLAETVELVSPGAGQLFAAEEPLPVPRPPDARPSADELIDSDEAAK